MANSPTSIETQIDSFLEQFKRSASKAMEERMEWPDGPSPGGVVKSRSSCFALDAAAELPYLRKSNENECRIVVFKIPALDERRYGNARLAPPGGGALY
ncbi:hypothetical protein SFRURICE_016478 [Spodoptera frugiperda]|uniref:SFRICE_008618 n=1 Tax=Spodoptera frugiperda TaxID=7108 RepID=A0A2H1V2F8_SPOFR|nr:hypothetical protein SFRURICE_016478 [Spodoptera frugiperda]